MTREQVLAEFERKKAAGAFENAESLFETTPKEFQRMKQSITYIRGFPQAMSRRDFLRLSGRTVTVVVLSDFSFKPAEAQADTFPIRGIRVVDWQPGQAPHVTITEAPKLSDNYFGDVSSDIQRAITAISKYMRENNLLDPSAPNPIIDVVIEGKESSGSDIVIPIPRAELIGSRNILVTTTDLGFSVIENHVWLSRNTDFSAAMQVYDAKTQKELAPLPEDSTVIPRSDKLHLITPDGTEYARGHRSIYDGTPGRINWVETKVWDPETQTFVDRASNIRILTSEELSGMDDGVVAGIEMTVNDRSWQLVTNIPEYQNLFNEENFNPYIFARYLDALKDHIPGTIESQSYRIKLYDINTPHSRNPGYQYAQQDGTVFARIYTPTALEDIHVVECRVDVDPKHLSSDWNSGGVSRVDGSYFNSANIKLTEFALGAVVINSAPGMTELTGWVYEELGNQLPQAFTYYREYSFR